MKNNKPKKNATRKSWFKVAKKVHALNKKQNLGWTWNESLQFASKKVYPKFKDKPLSSIKVADIEERFKYIVTDEGENPIPIPIPVPTPPKKEKKCFSALNVPIEDLIEREWWSIADDDVWANFDPNLPMRFAFDSIGDTGIIMKSDMPDMLTIREDIRKSDVKYGLVVFKLMVHPDKKDDGKPCSYYILVTLENSVYDQSITDGEIYGQKTEGDLTEEQIRQREERKIQREKLVKQKTIKENAKKRERPKDIEPKNITKSKSTSKKNVELEKIKLEKNRLEALKSVLEILKQDFKDGILTKRQYLQRQKQIIEKFENGGQI